MHVGRLHGGLGHDRGRPDRGDEDQLLPAGWPGGAARRRPGAEVGPTIAFTEGELYDADGRLLAKATGTAVPTPFKIYKK